MKSILKEAEDYLKQTLEGVRHELSLLRTGQASLTILEPVRVDYYGTKVPLSQVANMSIPDATSILIQPWDPKTCAVIERAILEANIGLTPTSDGRVIRLNIPSLTTERRKELVKKAKEIAERGRVSIRRIRHEARSKIEVKCKAKEISEDERDSGYESIQKFHDKFIAEIDTSLEKREKDIMEV